MGGRNGGVEYDSAFAADVRLVDSGRRGELLPVVKSGLRDIP